MHKFTAAGDGANNVAAALGGLARDLTDEEYERADAAGLLNDDARALFEHAPDKAVGGATAPAERTPAAKAAGGGGGHASDSGSSAKSAEKDGE